MCKLSFETYDEVLNFYEHFKDDETEYLFKNGDEKIPMGVSFFELQKNAVKSKQVYSTNKLKAVVNDRIVIRFHPNIINNQRFWKLAKEKFPLYSVCGSPTRSIAECNEQTFNFAAQMGLIKHINILISENNDYLVPRKLNFLEIGYGHGNVFYRYKDSVNYIGIDYTKSTDLEEYNNLLIIKKSGIPRIIKHNTQDIVYCFNVLQHCSQHDRFNYFKQSYKKLKKGGYFMGGMFMETYENQNDDCWGVEDRHGRKYTIFFNQLTEVDTIKEFTEITKEIGFEIINITFLQNYCSFVLKK